VLRLGTVNDAGLVCLGDGEEAGVRVKGRWGGAGDGFEGGDLLGEAGGRGGGKGFGAEGAEGEGVVIGLDCEREGKIESVNKRPPFEGKRYERLRSSPDA
jgi:hypothetical protein